MSAAHDNKDLDDFILHLIRNPAFPSKVNDVVVECGNSLYQPVLDRYVAGAEVPLSEVRQVWRNTTQVMCGVSGFYEEFFPLVRRINQKLPQDMKLRVLAADPPIDWSKAAKPNDIAVIDRDANIASVMEKEVLSKHRKALMLFGIAHLLHGGDLAVGLYEKDYPGVTLVIGDHLGFYNWTLLAKYNDELEARLSYWPVPSLVQNIKGTWLGALDMIYFSKKVDAYLYLGPRDLLLREPKPAEIFLDKEYMAELQRRAPYWEEVHFTEQANPQKVVEHDTNPFLYDPDLLRRAMLGMNSLQSASSAKEDRARTTSSSNAQPVSTEEVSLTIHLSPEFLDTFAGKYAPDSTSGKNTSPIEITANQEGLWVDLGVEGKRKFVPLTPTEFMEDATPGTRIMFTKDEKGRIAGLIFKGVWLIRLP